MKLEPERAMRLSEVVKEMDGELLADGEFETVNYCTAETEETFLTFMENPKFLENINPKVTCVICSSELKDKIPKFVKGIFITRDPKYCFHKICNAVNKKNELPKWETKIGKNCDISPLAYIASNNVIIGDNVVIEPFAIVNENVTIKDNCKIYARAVLGGRSFSMARSSTGEMCGLDDRGQVILEPDVEVFSETHIAQGIWQSDITHIGMHTKIDALCHIGHGAKLGNSVLVAAEAIIGGNTQIGDNTWVGINATVSNRLKIGKNSRISLGAVVTKNVADNTTVTGNFAIEHRKFIEHIKEINK